MTSLFISRVFDFGILVRIYPFGVSFGDISRTFLVGMTSKKEPRMIRQQDGHDEVASTNEKQLKVRACSR